MTRVALEAFRGGMNSMEQVGMQERDRDLYRRIVHGMAYLKNGGEVVDAEVIDSTTKTLPVEVVRRRPSHTLAHWRGRRIEDMSRQELIDCIDDLSLMVRERGKSSMGFFFRR
ncbi:MAG: hypothetical protein AAGF51_11760 [Pseudomonadota bacterium]